MSVLSFESILQNFRYRRGLYLLGAGSSAGLAPIGHGLYRIAALDWWRNGGGFSPDIPVHSPLVQKIIESQIDCPQEEIWGRPIRIGTEPFPAREMLQQLPNGAARLHVMHELLKKRHENEATDSYGVFRAFHPSIILNYNHDGFAVAQCGDKHWVIDIHGSIDPWYGSPDVKELIGRVREFDVSIPTGDLIMCERETRDNVTLLRRLAAAAAVMPDFVAIIGYSFARVPDGHDDCVSFDWFRHKFRGFNGPIFVIDPHPEELASEIADAIKSPHVFGVTALWNHLSHAFVMQWRVAGTPSRSTPITRNYVGDTATNIHSGLRDPADAKPAAPVSSFALEPAAGRRSHRVAHLAGVSGSVAAGPQRGAVPQGRVEVVEGSPEAGEFRAAVQRAPRCMLATADPFVTSRTE